MWNFSRLASLYTHQWIPVKDVWFSMTYDEQVIESPFSFLYGVTNATEKVEPILIA